MENELRSEEETAMVRQPSYHMRDQVRDRVDQIMQGAPAELRDDSPAWPLAVIVAALTLATTMLGTVPA